MKLYDIKAIAVQKHVFKMTMPGRRVNSRKAPKKMERKTLPEGIVYVNDICYGDKYPNSFLDIWYASADTSVKRPTFIYIHGGGNIFGDKVAGDPLAIQLKTELAYYKDLAARGFNVVSANYCFAPKYRAPSQIFQVNALFDFLYKNQDELHLDMNNVFLGGSSAGANYTAIYALALCDRAYAEKLGFVPSIKKDVVKALVIDECCLNGEAILTSEGLTVLMNTWVGEKGLKNDLMHLFDVEKNIKDTYIPSYITASNAEKPFETCATLLRDKLNGIGVDCQMYYKPISESEEMVHGFMANFANNKYSKECYEGMIAFIKKYL